MLLSSLPIPPGKRVPGGQISKSFSWFPPFPQVANQDRGSNGNKPQASSTFSYETQSQPASRCWGMGENPHAPQGKERKCSSVTHIQDHGPDPAEATVRVYAWSFSATTGNEPSLPYKPLKGLIVDESWNYYASERSQSLMATGNRQIQRVRKESHGFQGLGTNWRRGFESDG